MSATTHIKTSKRTYYGTILLGILVFLSETYRTKNSLSETASSTLGIIGLVVILFSLCKIFFDKGKIILTETGFKVQGYNWTSWSDLISVYPFVEQDLENGPKNFIHFRLRDGTDLSVRSENLEMSFEQIADLVNQYKSESQKLNQ